jgi:hypothetical protein
MSEQKNHIGQYSADDIRRYLEGKMSYQDMHAMEKAAIEDPFLAEAMEGIEMHIQENGPDAFEQDMEELKARMRERQEKRKLVIRGMAWLKIAAVFLVMAGGVAVTLILTRKQSSQLAKRESSRDTIHRNYAFPDHITDSIAPSPAMSKTITRSVPDISNDKAKMRGMRQKEKEEEIPALKSASIEMGKQDSNLMLEKTPVLAGSVPGTEQKIAERALEGRAAGVVISKGPSSSSFDEVVVMGYSPNKKKAKSDRSRQMVERKIGKRIIPDGGWDAFENYISALKSAVDSAVTGQEELTFTVDKTERPSNIRIIRSVSQEYDAKVIQLLTNGPNWKVLKGKKREVRLTIFF